MTARPLPTRHDEDFRYADLAALDRAWPVAVETIAVAAGETRALSLTLDGDTVARELAITLADDATLDLRALNLARTYGRLSLRVTLGARARFTLGAAQVGAEGATLEVVSHVEHAAPDAISRQVVRSVLGAKAVGTYLGKVRVAPGADGTDGEQSVRAMLLHPTATANARPELEIYADDVKCAHGCAVGELDAGALFYMAARGLAPDAAKRLMLQAFLVESFVGAAEEEALNAAALAALEAL